MNATRRTTATLLAVALTGCLTPPPDTSTTTRAPSPTTSSTATDTPEPALEPAAAAVTAGHDDRPVTVDPDHVAEDLTGRLFTRSPAHVRIGDDPLWALSVAARAQLPALPAGQPDDGPYGPALDPAWVVAHHGWDDPPAPAHDVPTQLAAGQLLTDPAPAGNPTRTVLGHRPGGQPTDVVPGTNQTLQQHGHDDGPAVVIADGSDPAVTATAVALAHAAGADPAATDADDPRTDPAVIDTIADHDAAIAVATDAGRWGNTATWSARAAVARTGTQLPGGGQTIFDGKTYIALYGHPGAGSLGVLGEQGPAASVDRAVALADAYRPLTDDTVVPTFEIIATVASGDAGTDGDYSNEPVLDTFAPHIEAAADAGIYVLLDLQPGRTDFLTQAKQVAPLLEQPHVGLALDPEWRLDPCPPKCRHLEQIGSVSAAEVTAVADWLDQFVADRQLPNKMLLLHQFRTSMLRGRETIPTGYDHIELAVQMDGQGSQPAKDSTWHVTTDYGPDGLAFGWKNFHDEDHPMLDPAGTMAKEPTPKLVSYQ